MKADKVSEYLQARILTEFDINNIIQLVKSLEIYTIMLEENRIEPLNE